MLKREAHVFTRNNEFQDFLDRMDDGTTIAHYSVSNEDVHYTITERELSNDEAKDFKMKQLRTDAEIISNKRNRMECQMFNLNSKANKLEEVLETIKEFE